MMCAYGKIILFVVAVIRYWIRVFWDTAMFHLVIKNRGRIPASDSFVVKRIAGPGLASDYYYQVSCCFFVDGLCRFYNVRDNV